MLLGSQEALRFDVQSVPHHVVLENVPAAVDRPKMLADLQRLVAVSARLIGDIPYQHYTFLMMGTGNGGIEHANSASIHFNGNSLLSAEGYQRWLSYVAHEYFHHYNVKRIRPLALGPFDYDRENLTTMLWVSEGLSVYYQDIVMVRAGLTTPAQYLAKMQGTIARVENATGHRYQPVAEASLAAWGGSGIGGDRNTSVSYYDKGPVLGLLLDLQIRHESKNQKSLDDVMRALYRRYYQQQKRGFTDAEFRQECEQAAGTVLNEVFEYVATTKEIDYPKYFAYAGLEIDLTAKEGKGAHLGVNTRSQESKLFVAGVSSGSPAEKAGLREDDEILEVDGAKATVKGLSDLLLARRPGDKIRLKVARSGVAQEVEAELGAAPQRSFRIQASANPAPLPAAILRDWLREGQ
jgi:predicted metalloprotease with PDZ domain